MNGFGIYYYQNDVRFEGEWVNNKKHGLGWVFYKNELKFEGEF